MGIRNRRQGREAALRVLYELEIGGSELVDALEGLREQVHLQGEVHRFAVHLIRGVLDEEESIDDAIVASLTDWSIDRVAAVDRNVLRIATFEIYHCPEIPPAVSVNEAVELAKKYSTAESGKFVNGVLGGILAKSPKANWDPAMAPEAIEEWAEPEDVEIEEVDVEEGSQEAAELAKVGLWKLKSE